MTIVEDGTRDLLPPIEADPEEIIGTQTLFAGSVALAMELPVVAALTWVDAAGCRSAADRAVERSARSGFPEQPAAVPIKGLAASVDAPDVSDCGPRHSHLDSEDVSVPEHSSTDYGGGGAGGRDHREGGSDAKSTPAAERRDPGGD